MPCRKRVLYCDKCGSTDVIVATKGKGYREPIKHSISDIVSPDAGLSVHRFEYEDVDRGRIVTRYAICLECKRLYEWTEPAGTLQFFYRANAPDEGGV